MEAYLGAMRRYAAFGGRDGRGGYWAFLGMTLLVTTLLALIAGIASRELGEAVHAAAWLAHLLPALAAASRRLHDSGRSGWWQLVGLVPVVGLPWLVVLLLWKGEAGGNRFGPAPGADDGAPGRSP